MSRACHEVYVRGAAAVSAFGFGWHGLGGAAMARGIACAPSRQLSDSHGDVLAYEVPPIPGTIDIDVKARKLMSYPARLGSIALRQALENACWDNGREEIALFLGVGASGGSMAELTGMLRASIVDHAFSMTRFGTDGLAACNPLFAFQLMNNFTLCHGAIQHGIGGPNSAFYSRGNGTVAALSEAFYLVASGECDRVLAGGADSALHAVTWAQLCRDGYPDHGYVPGEGAALLALGREEKGAQAILTHCEFHTAARLKTDSPQLIHQMLAAFAPDAMDVVVLAPWGDPARELLRHACSACCADAVVLDFGACLGDALAAAPALAWVAALDLLISKKTRRAMILNAGIDGGIGLVVLRSIA